MSATRPLVRMKLVQVEAMLTALGATGTGIRDQTRSLGQRLPQTLQADLKQVGYIEQRVMYGGSELDDVDTQRFQLLTERVVAALEQVQASASLSSESWRPDSPGLPVWGYFTEGVTKHYADFSGRARRREYWMFTLFHSTFALLLILLAAVSSVSSNTTSEGFSPLGLLIFNLLKVYLAATFIPQLAVLVRRLHDQGNSGWLVSLNFVGLGLITLILSMLDSKPGMNKWGPNPK